MRPFPIKRLAWPERDAAGGTESGTVLEAGRTGQNPVDQFGLPSGVSFREDVTKLSPHGSRVNPHTLVDHNDGHGQAVEEVAGIVGPDGCGLELTVQGEHAPEVRCQAAQSRDIG